MKVKHLLLAAISLTVILNACNNAQESTGSADTTVALTDTTIAMAATPAPAMAGNGITGKKWRLIELMGKAVADSVNGKEPFIMFKMDDSTYNANGGCNGLGGKFILDEAKLRLQFKQGMSTMMACPDMSVEDGLKKVLTSTDNYTVNDTILSLNKARMAPLARFRVVQ
ncbi:MAG TPA: META domain-containing protein [Parafilimonas sp.]|nr:META domain-containing protein [Parafilimonas sp.]